MTRMRPTRPAISPWRSDCSPSVAETVELLTGSRWIGIAPELSWSASVLALDSVNPPEISAVSLSMPLGLSLYDTYGLEITTPSSAIAKFQKQLESFAEHGRPSPTAPWAMSRVIAANFLRPAPVNCICTVGLFAASNPRFALLTSEPSTPGTL